MRRRDHDNDGDDEGFLRHIKSPFMRGWTFDQARLSNGKVYTLAKDDAFGDEWVRKSLEKMGLSRVVQGDKVSYRWAAGFGPATIRANKQSRA